MMRTSRSTYLQLLWPRLMEEVLRCLGGSAHHGCNETQSAAGAGRSREISLFGSRLETTVLNVDAAPTDSAARLDRLLWRQQERSQRILVLSSYSRSLTNFRLELLKSMVRAGHVVVAAGPEDDPEVKADLFQDRG